MPNRHAIPIRSEDDIIAAVLARRGRTRSLRALGSGGSKNGSLLAPAAALRLDLYDEVRPVGDDRVIVQAGVTISRLNEVLLVHGLAIPTHGEWAGGTLGGAVANGTHGGSSVHGISSTSILAIRVITADGSPLELDRDSPGFNEAAVSLGMLGVTSTVTLACVPHFHLALETRVHSFAEYAGAHDAACGENEFYSAVWFPAAHRVVTFAGNRAPAAQAAGHRGLRMGVGTFLLAAMSNRVPLPDAVFKLKAGTTIGPVGQILSPIEYGRRRLGLLRRLSSNWTEVEYAVPLERAVESLLLLDRFMAQHRDVCTHPVGLRATARDDFPLSPCHGRDTFWLSVSFRKDPRLEDELARLLMGLDARCHWGKHIGLPPDYLRSQYDGWGAFAALRRRLDPDHIFANDFTDRFFQ